MLERAGFDITPVEAQLGKDEVILERNNVPHTGDVYFSPFQQLGRVTLVNLTPDLVSTKEALTVHTDGSHVEIFDVTATPERQRALLGYKVGNSAVAVTNATRVLADEIYAAYKANKSDIAITVEALAQSYSAANQDVFYPVVAKLFCLLGFDCRTSRRGVNYARADAIIVDKIDSIPIEIKSPGEEMEISVKGVRQALENKVVLLSRKSHPTSVETTSLVVGYNPPNDRSEVHELVEDIRNAFGIRVGVIDFRSLLALCVRSIVIGKRLHLDNFRTLQGVIRV